MPKEVFFPLINPNEPEAVLADLYIEEGRFIQGGSVLCTLETTKSTAEVIAEDPGYIVGLSWQKGQTVRAGERLCYLANEPNWKPPQDPILISDNPPELIPGLRITQPALALARLHGLDLTRLPLGEFITEAFIQQIIKQEPGVNVLPAQVDFDPTIIIVYGGGGHGKSCIDLLRSLGMYQIVGVLDDGLPAGGSIMGLSLLGGGEKLEDLYAQGVRLAINAVGGIGNVQVRIKVFQRLAQAGFACPAVAHPAALIEPSARLSPGVQVFPHAYIGSETEVGYGAIINTGAIVSHDCRLGDYSNISPGATLAGGVEVGRAALVGMGATINLGAQIGAGARIGNGATVKASVPDNGVVRAGSIYPR
jgi:sugar O-acyltransferase (sialic acid O-acetyltransferase NeuD family)